MHKEESGRILSRLAAAKGLSAYAIARHLGISHTTAYGWLGGQFKPGQRHLPALARLLEVPVDEISDDGAALSEEQRQRVEESVLEVALAALEHGDLVVATEEEIGEPATWTAAKRAAIAGVTPAALKTLLDALADGDFLSLPRHRMVALIEAFLRERKEPDR